MKFLSKKIYIILILLIIFFGGSETFAKGSQIQYKSENIYNYFSGIISANQDYNDKAFEHLKKVTFLKNSHSNFNVEFIRTLVLIEKFEKAVEFSRSIWNEEELIFEADLLLGLESFLKKDYVSAERYFDRLNRLSEHNIFFDNFIGNVLTAWSKASQGNKKGSFDSIKKIPEPYDHLKKPQNIFLQCYFDDIETKKSFQELSNDNKYNFSRYNFFLVNYLIHRDRAVEAKKVIKKSREKYPSNILIKETENFLLKNKNKKIKNFFDCKNTKDSIAEFFYVIANIYSSEKDYQLSNFYLKISILLNERFTSNKALLAENYYFQKKNKYSKNIYESLKSIGPTYSWYAAKNIAEILEKEKGKKYSVDSLQKEFDLLQNPQPEDYYELANFYKRKEYYKESIKYYSLALKNLKKNHSLIPKILDRRGTSYERLDNWENAEKDLIKSLEILPDQPHVLNYLAYTWADKGINIDKSLEMLKKANSLKQNDGYIIDSLGWTYYVKKNYNEAEFFLQQAVQLLPQDPIINDHYADVLWMLGKNIQARYFWRYVLGLRDAEKELKDNVNKKLIFGISKKL